MYLKFHFNAVLIILMVFGNAHFAVVGSLNG